MVNGGSSGCQTAGLVKVLICPDSFTGTLSAAEAAAGDGRGLGQRRPWG